MTSLLAPLRRRPRSAGPIVTEIAIRCDRDDRCTTTGHPYHVIRVETVHAGVADVTYRVTATLAGVKMRAPWNFAERDAALEKHSELVATFRQYVAAAEELAVERSVRR